MLFGGEDSKFINFNLGAISSGSFFFGVGTKIINKFEQGEGYLIDDVFSSLLERS